MSRCLCSAQLGYAHWQCTAHPTGAEPNPGQNTKAKDPSDEGSCCARGGTRTGLQHLQTLHSPENIRNPARSGTDTAESEARSVHIVHIPFWALRRQRNASEVAEIQASGRHQASQEIPVRISPGQDSRVRIQHPPTPPSIRRCPVSPLIAHTTAQDMTDSPDPRAEPAIMPYVTVR
jgi:hypothetical protein